MTTGDHTSLTAAPSRPAPAYAPDASRRVVDQLLQEARQALDLPVAFVSRFAAGRRVVESLDATCPVPFDEGDSHPEQDTYCRRIVDGELPEAIADTAADPVTASLAVTRELRIGSYVGVPIQLPDGTVYGTLCAYAEQARPVDERDAAVLHLVARSIGLHLGTRLRDQQRSSAVRQRVRDVVEHDRLTSVYQPIIDLTTGAVVALEALSRFPSSYGRRPAQWFAEAREAGDSEVLELAAARRAVRALAGLPGHVALTVNVSAAVATTPAFLDWLADAPVERLVLELTEHEQVADYDDLRARLAPARERGLRLAVDDAGAGYAGMRHTLQLEPELIKLDVSMVRGLDADRGRRALCRALVTFAHSMGARVVAEGVETQVELNALRRLGADFAQGYLLQRPAPVSEIPLSGYATTPRRRPVPPPAQPPTAEQVATILELRLSGASSATVAARLNQLGDLQPGGLRWNQGAVDRAIRQAADRQAEPALHG